MRKDEGQSRPLTLQRYEAAKRSIKTGASISKACQECNLSTGTFDKLWKREMGNKPKPVYQMPNAKQKPATVPKIKLKPRRLALPMLPEITIPQRLVALVGSPTDVLAAIRSLA